MCLPLHTELHLHLQYHKETLFPSKKPPSSLWSQLPQQVLHSTGFILLWATRIALVAESLGQPGQPGRAPKPPLHLPWQKRDPCHENGYLTFLALWKPPATCRRGTGCEHRQPFYWQIEEQNFSSRLMREILICTMLVAKQPDCRLPKLLAVLFKEVSKWDYASNGNWIEKVSPALFSQSWNQEVTQFSKFFSSWVANTSPIIHAPWLPLLAFSQKLR